jgi:predicted nucleic acid-binding protein
LIVLDTSFLFALKAEKDKNFSRANEILEMLFNDYNDIKITPYLVANETITLAVARFYGNMDYLEKYFNLIWGEQCFFDLLNFEITEYQKIYHVLEQYCTRKKQLSYTDASLIYLCKKYKETRLVSFDKHFDNIVTRLF